jgi:hypothetical protein
MGQDLGDLHKLRRRCPEPVEVGVTLVVKKTLWYSFKTLITLWLKQPGGHASS